jgi:hypothetical protein
MLVVAVAELTVVVLPVQPHMVVARVAQQLSGLPELPIPAEVAEVAVALRLRQVVTVVVELLLFVMQTPTQQPHQQQG